MLISCVAWTRKQKKNGEFQNFKKQFAVNFSVKKGFDADDLDWEGMAEDINNLAQSFNPENNFDEIHIVEKGINPNRDDYKPLAVYKQ